MLAESSRSLKSTWISHFHGKSFISMCSSFRVRRNPSNTHRVSIHIQSCPSGLQCTSLFGWTVLNSVSWMGSQCEQNSGLCKCCVPLQSRHCARALHYRYPAQFSKIAWWSRTATFVTHSVVCSCQYQQKLPSEWQWRFGSLTVIGAVYVTAEAVWIVDCSWPITM